MISIKNPGEVSGFLMDNSEKKLLSRALGVREEGIYLYPLSRVDIQGITLQMARIEKEKQLLVTGDRWKDAGFHGQPLEDSGLLCPLTHENRLVLNRLLPFTKPAAFGREIPTFGTGDRLGIATPGHILAFSRSKARPILAQQSMRELSLTGRSYRQVLDDVCFSVFQEGYRHGFGADGDHLKLREDIQAALEDGYTMITLDCSDQIGKGIDGLSPGEAEQRYMALPDAYRQGIESRYLRAPVRAAETVYTFSRRDLIRCVLIYGKAIDYAEEVYRQLITAAGRPVDFELSVDETESVTTALDHLFVASELLEKGVEITSLAPRFTGEFQKGIDYIGNIEELNEQAGRHAEIAKSFGYKLSVHSGSDKFSVFPLIGRAAGDRLHVKTSGTNWLEAVRIITQKDPSLYRRMHSAALARFEDARKFYHVSADLSSIRPLEEIPDEELPLLLDEDNSRQLMHITYGYILADPRLKTDLYDALRANEEAYKNRLAEHIGKHLDSLGLEEAGK